MNPAVNVEVRDITEEIKSVVHVEEPDDLLRDVTVVEEGGLFAVIIVVVKEVGIVRTAMARGNVPIAMEMAICRVNLAVLQVFAGNVKVGDRYGVRTVKEKVYALIVLVPKRSHVQDVRVKDNISHI